MCGCAGWSAPLLFTNPEDKFSRLEAQKVADQCCSVRSCEYQGLPTIIGLISLENNLARIFFISCFTGFFF